MRLGPRPEIDDPPDHEPPDAGRPAASQQPPEGASAPPRAHGSSVASAAATFAYNPALDGLRVICIFIILAGHMGAIRASNVAVDMFCVLSGFLITALLLAEHTRTGTVSVGRFLVRRAFRLMPAMWAYLLVGLAVTVAFKWDDIAYRDDYIGSAVTAFFNVNNWYKVENPLAGGRWLAHVWSLSMEEQFYLVWPGLFLLFTRSRRLRPYLLVFLIASIGLVMGWTYVIASNGAPRSRVYLAADTHIAPLLVGCLLAVWRDNRLRALAGSATRAPAGADGEPRRRRGGHSAVTAAAVERWTTGRRLAALGLPAGVALVLLAFLGPSKEAHEPNWIDYLAYVPSAALGAIVILGADLNRDARWAKLVGSPKMAWTGKITFSIYLWHYPVISAASGQLVPRIGLWPAVVVASVITTIVAYFSNRFIEKPAQARRPKWADTPRAPARPRVEADAPAAVPAPAREQELPELMPALLGAAGGSGPADRPGPTNGWSDGGVDWVDEGYRDSRDSRDSRYRAARAAAEADQEPRPGSGLPGTGHDHRVGPPATGWPPRPDGNPSARPDPLFATGPFPGGPFPAGQSPTEPAPATGSMPVVRRPDDPRPGDVVYERVDGPAVYEHGPAVGTAYQGGAEPTPVPDWAVYPTARSRAAQAAAQDGAVRPGTHPAPGAPWPAGGETMNLQVPERYREPAPDPDPGGWAPHHAPPQPPHQPPPHQPPPPQQPPVPAQGHGPGHDGHRPRERGEQDPYAGYRAGSGADDYDPLFGPAPDGHARGW